MDFGNVLKEWEDFKKNDKSDPGLQGQRKQNFSKILENYEPDKQDLVEKENGTSGSTSSHRSPKNIKSEMEVDLHGFTIDEAQKKVDEQIDLCLKKNIKKILFIPGKGLHSKKGPVLARWLKSYLQDHPKIGAIGHPKQNEGGSGSLWAIIRIKSKSKD